MLASEINLDAHHGAGEAPVEVVLEALGWRRAAVGDCRELVVLREERRLDDRRGDGGNTTVRTYSLRPQCDRAAL